MKTQNYLKVLEEAIEKSTYIYYKNNIKIIDLPPYSPDLNLIENIWTIIKRKIAEKKLLQL